MKQNNESLGPGGINWRASRVADGTGSPDEARELIVEFVHQARTGRVEPILITHIADCLDAFLVGKRSLLPAPEIGRYGLKPVPIQSLEKAFGLTRVTKGRPAIDSDTRCVVAMEVLRRMLGRETLEVASECIAAERWKAGLPISSETDVRDAWAKNKFDGLLYLRISRLREVDPTAPPWTPEEIERLDELFMGEPWYVPPGIDIKAHADAKLGRLGRTGKFDPPEKSMD